MLNRTDRGDVAAMPGWIAGKAAMCAAAAIRPGNRPEKFMTLQLNAWARHSPGA